MATPCEFTNDLPEDPPSRTKVNDTGRTLTADGPRRLRRDPKEVALQHARILQQRKELETLILQNLITLSEYPRTRTPPHSSANPAISDVAGFKKLVRLFQPSDYDDLIAERNANRLCGYALCGKSKIEATPGGAWKLVSTGEKGFDIVHRKEHEQWCSQSCARRALYVKVQLNETAAWERVGIPDIDIEILEEAVNTNELLAVGKRKQQSQLKAAEDASLLATERGDTGTRPPLLVALRPKEITAPPKDMDIGSLEYDDDAHLRLEGYKPKSKVSS